MDLDLPAHVGKDRPVLLFDGLPVRQGDGGGHERRDLDMVDFL